LAKTPKTSEIAHELATRLPGLDRLWSLTKGRPEIVIAVLDGPVDPASVSNAGLGPSGVVEHGTHVYSIISGSGDGIIPGIAPECKVVSIPIFDAAPAGNQPVCTQERLAAGIRNAVAERANIINVSASQQADLLSLSSDLSDALQQAGARDVLVVAATGNQGCACDTIPASVPGVLAVGAHGEQGSPLLSSNWGPGQRAQGLLAPGAGVPGACVGGGLCRASGTSFATAMVSGVAGLLMSFDAERGLKPSGDRIRRALLSSCIRPPQAQVEMASTHLSGRLDVSRAVDHLLGPSATASTGEATLTTSSLPDNAEARSTGPSAPHDAVATTGDATRIEVRPPASQASGRGLVLADCGCGCGGSGGDCTCGGAQKKPQLVYAIGRLGVSFISQARRDAIWRDINRGLKKEESKKPLEPLVLQEFFKKEPFQAQSVVWTISRTDVPMYAIVPVGAFAANTYKWLVEEWADKKVEFISLPGVLAGQVALYDGQIVDAVVPDLRGMFSWNTDRYVESLRATLKKTEMSGERIERDMKRFFGKIQFSIRNRGLSPEERAINAAATNAFNISDIIVEAGEEGMTLRDVGVERSPVNRPGSEYFDVLLTFFDPRSKGDRAPLRSRFTIDVSDTVPVPIGDPVTWHEF
jgi:cyanobactin maturation PatA/PatG family protease